MQRLQKIILFYFIYLLPFSIVHSQNSKDLNLKIQGANQLMIEKKYSIAKDLWMEIVKQQPKNANTNYKTGLCLLESSNSKLESLKYLKIAAKKISKNYSPFDNTITTAPIEANFYLGKSYHINGFQDSAIIYLKKFKELASKKHYLKSENEKLLKWCENEKIVTDNSNNHLILDEFKNTNTTYDDFNPQVSRDGNTIVFSSNRTRSEKQNEEIFDINTGNHFVDLYVIYKDLKNESWMEPKLLKFSKSKSNQITIGKSNDIEKVFFTNGGKDSKGKNTISYSRKNQNFSYAKEFLDLSGFNISSLMITDDGENLFFSSDKSGGYGGEDLWVCKRENNSWSKPTNMGASINSQFDEICPFLHPDGMTFFYSSNGEKSIGGYDVFYNQKGTDKNWSNSVNLGTPINTVNDEIYFSTSLDGKKGYYSSSNSQQNLDIYSVDIANPYSNPVVLLNGYIDKGNSEALVYNFKIKLTNTDLDNNSKFYEPNKFNGTYSFNVEQCYHYDVQYYKSFTLSSGKVKEVLIQEQTIKVPCEIDEGLTISLPIINTKGELLENNNYEIPRDSILKILDKKIKKYSFKDIINTDNKLIGLLLIDEDGNIIDRAILTPDGFKFEILSSSSNYNFKLENFPDSLELSDIPIILIEEGRETLIHGDFGENNTFKYVNNFNTFKFKELVGLNNPLFKAYLIDENGTIIQEGLLTENGFKFELISSSTQYKFKLENIPKDLDLSEIPIEIVNHNETLSIMGDFSNKNEFLLPKIHFKKTFQTNEYDIESQPDFLKFMELSLQKVKENGKVKLEIVGSASRIPSTKFKNNTELAKLRIEKGKKIIYDYLDSKNISRDSFQIIKEKAIVSGPKYNYKAKDKSIYYQYQYFSIWAE
ncbi:MAG: hypothetical protein VW078_05335 [Flavobacteriales bacterium]